MKFNPRLGDIVAITWEDHYSDRGGWTDVEKNPTPSIIKSVGYVVAITPKLIVLAPTFDTVSKDVSGAMGRLRNCIVKGAILRRGS